MSPLYLLMRALGLRDTWLALILANAAAAAGHSAAVTLHALYEWSPGSGFKLMAGTELLPSKVLGSAWPQHFNKVVAEAAYAKARVERDRATGQILYNNNVSMDEAVKGVVSRPSNPLPPEAQ